MNFLKRSGEFVLRAPSYAGGIALLCAIPSAFGIPFLSWISLVVLAFVTLREGARAGFLVLVWSAIPSAALFFLNKPELFYEQVLSGALVLWLLSIILRYTSRWSTTVEYAIGLGAVGVIIAHLLIPNIAVFWTQYLQHMLNELNASRGSAVLLSKSVEFYVIHMATGFAAIGIITNALFNLIMARFWQASLFNPGGLRVELYAIRLHYRVVIALVILSFLAWARVTLAWDIIPLVVVALSIGGLSVAHSLISRFKYAWIWLAIFYVILVFEFLIVGTLLVILGIVDSLVNIRARVVQK